MIDKILNTEIQHFINRNLNSEIATLLLKGSPFPEVNIKNLVEQIEAKKRCENKLKSWFQTEDVYYPNKLNIEQTSSETTAKFKSELISGDAIIDLTGGFGVDCFYFSKLFKNVTHCEINENLSSIVNHNYKQLKVSNVKTISGNGLDYLTTNNTHYDWIYIDPSRRHDSKGKVFFLNDCLPNVPQNLEVLFKHTNNILIKTSPLLDLSIGINELKHVKTIHIIAVNNEVKELLWVLNETFTGDITIETVNIKSKNTEYFDYILNNEKQINANLSEPRTYLYEPNAAVLKAGAFDSVSEKLNVYKLHKHSHLYTNDVLIDFPGRSFKIENIIPYNKKSLKKLSIPKANITTRNFPETVQQIRKKLKIKDGGDVFLFFTTNTDDDKIVIVASKS